MMVDYLVVPMNVHAKAQDSYPSKNLSLTAIDSKVGENGRLPLPNVEDKVGRMMADEPRYILLLGLQEIYMMRL